MQPFDRYPAGGVELLGPLAGANARHEYGRRLAESTGVTWCAYCGLDLFAAYEHWLLLQVDHVVPVAQAVRLGVPPLWANDRINAVLACAGCNGFDNRYVAPAAPPDAWTLPAFLELRDRIFAERWHRIAARRTQERTAFDRARLAARVGIRETGSTDG